MNNKAKYIFISTIIGILVMICLQACDLRSFVKVDIPTPVLEATGNEAPVSLNKSEGLRQDWIYYVESNTKKLDASIAESEATYATIHQIVSVGIDTVGQASNGIPYGGILFGALTGLAGLALPQPKVLQKKGS